MSAYNLEQLSEVASLNSWETILPEISLGILALALLVIELAVPHSRFRIIPRVAIWGQVAILVLGIFFSPLIAALSDTVELQTSFSGMLLHSLQGEVMRLFFLLSSILVCHLGNIYLTRQQLPKVEFFHIVMVVTAGLMLLAQSHNFVMLFVALETVTVGFYILVSYCRRSVFSLEAGLKYLILGALSSSVLLFGIVLLYGVAGNPNLPASSGDPMNFAALGAFINANPDNILVLTGAALVICGIAFKIGAVPFQIWIPDVYQGAPTPVTAFLAVASKAGGFIVLLNLITGPFASLEGILVPLLSAIAAVTILFGNLAALTQHNVKRLMGLSGIAHAGYILLGVVATFQIPWAANAVIFYLFTYLFASFGVFCVMALIAPDEDSAQTLEDYENLARDNPFLGIVLAIGLGSLAGIPPLAGFIGKLLIFLAAFQAGLYKLLVVAIIGVVISIYYYFGWIMAAFLRQYRAPAPEGEEAEPEPELPVGSFNRVIMACLTAVTILLGFYQGALSFLL